MKLLPTTLLFLSLLGLNGCESDKDSVAPAGIVGRWQLTELQCYCAPGLPNEAVEFKADGTVVFYRDAQEESRGTYRFTTGELRCYGPGTPVLQFTASPSVYDGLAAYTIEPNALVLDQGLCLDAPRKTYRRD